MFWWILGAVALIVFAYLGYATYLGMILRWEDEHTVGLAYYGLPLVERRAFRERLRQHARRLKPILWVTNRGAKLDFRTARIQYQGVSAPKGSCSVESFARAQAYQPRPEDVFVATQMKCGTTWMQHV